MKKILLLVVAVLFAATLFAENVDQNKAQRIAKAFAAQRDRNAAQLRTDIVYSHPMPNTRDAAFYVVNLENSGFVIVAANDVAHPVIGYSFDRPWPTTGNIPPQITDYLDDLANQIESAVGSTNYSPDRNIQNEWQELLSINPNNPPLPKGNRTEVGPLLTTTWDQGQYYNAMCPEDAGGPDGHAVTGCVATAMAQIIKYWGYPTSGRGIHSYQSNYGELSVNFAVNTCTFSAPRSSPKRLPTYWPTFTLSSLGWPKASRGTSSPRFSISLMMSATPAPSETNMLTLSHLSMIGMRRAASALKSIFDSGT